MAEIINFKSTQHEEEYYLVFEEHLAHYMKMLYRVKEEMYGTGGGNFSNLPGSCTQQVVEVTNSLLYPVNNTFKTNYPEYKTEDDEMFIPYRSFKENVSDALNEALDKRNTPWAHPESNLNNLTLGDK
jgi:hypothetical protein